MRQDTIAAVFAQVFQSGNASPHITVIWHAGEPLVLPVAYYEEAFAAIEALRPAEVQVRHAMQTNGMLLSAPWCELFRKWNVAIGVSIDGPRALHDAHRRTRSGRGTFDRVLAGIRTLRREGVPFHVIAVLGTASLDAPDALLEFFVEEGIEDVCFNVEESEGDHVSDLLAGADAQARFRAFLGRFWTLARQSGRIKFIREIDSLLPRIFRPDGTPIGNPQVEPFGMLNVDCHGNVSTFSPELLGLKNPRYDDFLIGNIHTQTLDQMAGSAAMQAMSRDIAAGVDLCQRECDYFSVCGGGSPVNKLSENGSFASARTAFCSLVHMVPTDLILEAFDRLEQQVAIDDSPADVLKRLQPPVNANQDRAGLAQVDATIGREISAAGYRSIPILARSEP